MPATRCNHFCRCLLYFWHVKKKWWRVSGWPQEQRWEIFAGLILDWKELRKWCPVMSLVMCFDSLVLKIFQDFTLSFISIIWWFPNSKLTLRCQFSRTSCFNCVRTILRSRGLDTRLILAASSFATWSAISLIWIPKWPGAQTASIKLLQFLTYSSFFFEYFLIII